MPRTHWFVLLLIGCARVDDAPAPLPAPADTAPTRVCSVAKKPNKGGFGPWYAHPGAHLLVHGDGPAEVAYAAQLHAYYATVAPGLELRPVGEVSDDDRAGNLMLVGTPSSNRLIAELAPHLPVDFTDEGFAFGGYVYDEPGNGVALIAPNPWGDDTWLTVYTGNTWGGALSTFTIPTGMHDYVTTRGRGVVQQQGWFCREDTWWFWPEYDEDDRAAFLAWRDALEVTTSEHHVFYYASGSDFEADVDWMPAWQEDRYADILATLEVEALEHPIATYLYDSNDEKGELTGVSGNGHANDLNYEVHAVYGGGVYAVGAHEDVHVVAWHHLGAGGTAVLGEGLAVMVDGEWLGQSLDAFAAATAAADDLVPLRTLVEDFWSGSDALTYGLAGHFVAFLLDGWGVDAVKRLYVRPDLEQAFVDELGLTLEEVEEAWLATID